MVRRLIAASIVLAMAAVPLAGCARAASRDIAVAGDTRVDLVTVAAPRLTPPAIDVTVGIVKPKRSDVDTPGLAAMMGAQMRSGAAKAAAAAIAARRPTAAGMLTAVMVRAGQTVRKGQVLARFDDALLRLGVQNAEMAERKAKTTPDVLASQASDLRDTRATARATGRTQLASAQQKIDAARTQLEAGIAQAQAAKKALPGMLSALPGLQAQLKALLAKPDKTPGDLAAITGLKAKIGDIMKAKAFVGGLPKMLAGLQQLATAQQQLDAGRAKLNSGIAKLSDAISQIDSGKDVAKVAVGMPAAAVAQAQTALANATLYAPCDGVVVTALHTGEVPMVGAPVVVIRPAGDTLIDTYLTSDQLARVRVGSVADVSMDSVRGSLHGRVQWISADQQFAPSNYPTQIVHLSRVVRVTVSVPDVLPAGVPADVVIHPSS